MDKLKYSFIIVLALILGSCRGVEPDGEVDDISSSGIVTLRFHLSHALSGESRDPFEAFREDTGNEMSVRVYLFRSATGESDDSFECVRPSGGEAGQDYLEFGLSQERFFGGFDVAITGDCYYRFLALGIRGDAFGNTDSGDGTVATSEIDLSEIDCASGTKWTDIRIRNVSESPSGRVGEIYSGVAVSDKISGSTDYYISGGGGSLNVEIELRRAVAGVMLCAVNVPSTIASDFSWPGSETGEEIVEQGESYAIDRIEIVAVGMNEAFNPASSLITSDYFGEIVHLATIDCDGAPDVETSIYCGANFMYPSRLADKSTVGEGLILNRSSLYLVLSAHLVSSAADGERTSESGMDNQGISDDGLRYYPLKVIPIKSSASQADGRAFTELSPNDDDWISADGFRYNLVGNHLYCLGTPESPVDLSKIIRDGNAQIEVSGTYQTDVNIPF